MMRIENINDFNIKSNKSSNKDKDYVVNINNNGAMNVNNSNISGM
jgi:hypothetical protein